MKSFTLKSRAAFVAGAATVALALAGCGGLLNGSSSSEASTEATASAPAAGTTDEPADEPTEEEKTEESNDWGIDATPYTDDQLTEAKQLMETFFQALIDEDVETMCNLAVIPIDGEMEFGDDPINSVACAAEGRDTLQNDPNFADLRENKDLFREILAVENFTAEDLGEGRAQILVQGQPLLKVLKFEDGKMRVEFTE